MSKIGKRAMLLLLALPIGFNVMAQETKKPTLEELIPETSIYSVVNMEVSFKGDLEITPSK